jgi:hypothetical protein
MREMARRQTVQDGERGLHHHRMSLTSPSSRPLGALTALSVSAITWARSKMETRSIETAPGMVFDVSAEIGDDASLPTNAAARPVLDPI